jgi:hypothetical protein
MVRRHRATALHPGLVPVPRLQATPAIWSGACRWCAATIDQTRITLKLDADPEGPVETAGAGLGFLERRVKGDLERFRDYVEATGPTGKGWRGEIHGDVVRSDDGA